MSPNHPQTLTAGMGAIAAGAACVLLRHDLPDGSSHVDWMLETQPASPTEEVRQQLLTFRLPARVDELRVGDEMAAERIADHRRSYLQYEGEVSGGRGRVMRLARGRVLTVEPASGEMFVDGGLDLAIRWIAAEKPGIVQRLRLACEGGRHGSRAEDAAVGRAGEGVRGTARGGAGGGGWIVRCVSREISAQ